MDIHGRNFNDLIHHRGGVDPSGGRPLSSFTQVMEMCRGGNLNNLARMGSRGPMDGTDGVFGCDHQLMGPRVLPGKLGNFGKTVGKVVAGL